MILNTIYEINVIMTIVIIIIAKVYEIIYIKKIICWYILMSHGISKYINRGRLLQKFKLFLHLVSP